ncbi:hypothetical protein AVV13_gp20 [Streptomyces phage SF1]|uniref:Uncharacterized protein n=1 Tax=Streptomyces phage SF1 TaxID=1690817 RepID=A0A0K1Y598_9CAUD|nr:hypothetical protein AVV13_gp20 [Streptomyces phage SF1]AKY02169.1 hypothetical protein SF1_200 [Streptomyces phage SF1]
MNQETPTRQEAVRGYSEATPALRAAQETNVAHHGW